MASTKSRQFIWGGRVKLAKMQAGHARKRVLEAAREADRAEAEAYPDGGLWWTGSTLTNDRPVHQPRAGFICDEQYLSSFAGLTVNLELWYSMCPMDAQTIEPRSKPVEPHCRRCDAVLYIVETILDPRTGRVVRMYKCECGERIWA